jgi:hypothetical protein
MLPCAAVFGHPASQRGGEPPMIVAETKAALTRRYE